MDRASTTSTKIWDNHTSRWAATSAMNRFMLDQVTHPRGYFHVPQRDDGNS